jgi:hypothetical protein
LDVGYDPIAGDGHKQGKSSDDRYNVLLVKHLR